MALTLTQNVFYNLVKSTKFGFAKLRGKDF